MSVSPSSTKGGASNHLNTVAKHVLAEKNFSDQCVDHVCLAILVLSCKPCDNIGTSDSEAIPEPAASLIEQLVTGAWADIADAGQMAKQAVVMHPQRADNYT